jgi:hypothetical protein
MNPIRKATYSILLVVASILAPMARAQSLSNFSARIDMVPGGNYIIGFAVPVQSTLLLRAVGPTLTSLGIANPVTQPGMQVYDSNGDLLYFSYGLLFPVGISEPVLPQPSPASLIATIFAAVGAFPLTGGESVGTAFNYGIFSPGSYTAKITDKSGLGGTILFEVYAVPNGVATLADPVSNLQIGVIFN